MRAGSRIETVTAADLARVLPITGYVDRLSARPGETLEVKVSAQGAGDYEADVVRIVCGDPNPEGPGVLLERQGFGRGVYPARAQPIDRGSYAVMPPHSAYAAPSLWVSALVQPWLLRETPATIAAARSRAGAGWTLEMDAQAVRLRYDGGDGRHASAEIAHGATPKTWMRVWARL